MIGDPTTSERIVHQLSSICSMFVNFFSLIENKKVKDAFDEPHEFKRHNV